MKRSYFHGADILGGMDAKETPPRTSIGHGGGHRGSGRGVNRGAFIPGLLEDVDDWYPDGYGVPVTVNVNLNEAQDEVLGAFDIQSAQKKMNGLKNMTVEQSKAMLNAGLSAINGAISTGKTSGVYGATSRSNVLGHLNWHKDNIDKLDLSYDAVYPSWSDLQKWAMQAMIEANAVDEGAQYLTQAWDDMWSEIGTNEAALPAKALSVATKAASEVAKSAVNVVSSALGVPTWAIGAGAALIVAALGYVVVTRIVPKART